MPDLIGQHDPSLPPAYCRTRWREKVLGLGLVASVVLGISVHGAMGAENGRGRYGLARLAPVALGGTTPPPGAPGWRAASNNAVSATDSNVRFVATAQRTAFTQAAAVIRPAVVGIRARLVAGPPGGSERFGSGVVVDPAGYVVTCRHVVADATSVVAHRFREPGRPLPASVIASEGDLALLRVTDATPFEAATLGDSERVQVGDWVLAVGHPFGLGLTVTAGIVGQRHAGLQGPGGIRYTDLLQTDAPMNEGSSGGPLVSADGSVVGLNAAIYAPTGVFSGASFAIPSNRVRDFVARALGTSPASPAVNAAAPSAGGWGVNLVDLTPSLSASLACPRASGAVVAGVELNSPAEAARLSRGDVIIGVAGQPVLSVASLQAIRAQLPAGSPLPLQIWRGGAVHTVVLTPGVRTTG